MFFFSIIDFWWEIRKCDITNFKKSHNNNVLSNSLDYWIFEISVFDITIFKCQIKNL